MNGCKGQPAYVTPSHLYAPLNVPYTSLCAPCITLFTPYMPLHTPYMPIACPYVPPPWLPKEYILPLIRTAKNGTLMIIISIYIGLI